MTTEPTTSTLVDLRELADDAAAAGQSDALEARFARAALGCERIGVSLQRVKPGRRSPFAHRHSVDEEVYVVVAGSGTAVVDGHRFELRPWSALRVAASAIRGFEAGDDGLELLAFGTHSDDDRSEFGDPGWDD